MLASVAALAAFYLVYMPQNYFGGSTFLGNRYFLVAYPALLLGIRRLPPPTLLAATVIVGLLMGGSAVASVRATRGLDATSQSHVAAGLFGFLPYESTAREIEGQRGRFWSRDYVRFINPYADVERRRFVLRSDRPAAEIMIASRIPRKTLSFLVRVRGQGRAAFDWRDWTRTGWVPLEGNKRRRLGAVTFRPATPWRSHPFAFKNDETYQVRVLELAIHPVRSPTLPERRLVEAEVFYLDDIEILRSYHLKLEKQRLPRRGEAGGKVTLRLRVRNRSKVAWDPDGVLPVLAGVRIVRPDAALDEEATEDEALLPPERRGISRDLERPEIQRFDLPHVVPPKELVDLELPVRLPDEPGSYRLEVDLALHPIYWFGQQRGQPLAQTHLEVVAPQPSPPQR